MAMVISIVNIKGGTGNTTTAHNLGAALAEYGKKVLLIDSDSQASLTKALGVRTGRLPDNTYHSDVSSYRQSRAFREPLIK